MKVLIERDEWWPIYTLGTDLEGWGTPAEMDEKEVKDILKKQAKFFKLFRECQDRLHDLYERKEAVNATTD